MKYTRFFRREYNEYIRDFSAFGNFFVLIGLLALVLKESEFLTAIIGLLITSMAGNVIKFLFHRKRPKHIYYTNSLEKIQSGSFPSIHSANIMFAGLVIIKTFSSMMVDVFFTLAILIVGYSRYHLRKHYLRDVVGGYVIGLIVFLSFYYGFI